MPNEQFSTGAVRDMRDGKGRYDLISPVLLEVIARSMEVGAIKYAERNWEKGMPFSRIMDSLLRHLNQFMQGDDTEDHLANAACNLMFLIHLRRYMPELNDLPAWNKRGNSCTTD